MTRKAWNKTDMERVAVLPWPGIEGAYLCVSGRQREEKCTVGGKWYPKNEEHREVPQKIFIDRLQSVPKITFLFATDNCCAEWDGEQGPIQLWFKCEKDWVDEDNEYNKAKPHWFFDYAYGSGHWSQLAVDEADLPRSFNIGDYQAIFWELKKWATR